MKKYYMCEKRGGPDPRDPPSGSAPAVACLNAVGNLPSVKERLAMYHIIYLSILLCNHALVAFCQLCFTRINE